MEIIEYSSRPDYELMAKPEWRAVQSLHREKLASFLKTRGDLLRLANLTNRGPLDAEALTMLSPLDLDGEGPIHLKVAQALLDAKQDPKARLSISERKRAAIMAAYGMHLLPKGAFA